MNILSVTAYSTNSSVVLCNNSKIVSAYYENQFSRRRYDCSFPELSLRHALNAYDSLDAILFSDSKHFKRFCKDMRRFSAVKPTLINTADALVQSVATVYKSNTSAVIAVNPLDGKHCISLGYYNGINTTWLKHIERSNCLYSLYYKVVKLLGLHSDIHAMLAARKGSPLWKNWAYENLISYSDGDIRIKNTSNSFGQSFLDYNIASTTQCIIQDIFVHLCDWLYNHLNVTSLIFAGSFSDNADLIAYLYSNTAFERIATSVDSSNSSCSLGAVAEIKKPLWETIYLGTECSNGITADEAANAILSGKIVPIIQGRTEFSTTSFGNRSFLAIPSSENAIKLNAMLNRPDLQPHNVICQDKEASTFYKITGCTRYRQATCVATNSNYKTEDDKHSIQTINMTNNAYINRILETTRQYGFPILLCADIRSGGKPFINTIQDYNNEIQLYN